MNSVVEKVIEMPQITEEKDVSKVNTIINELISMFFEMLISFVPIVLYWLAFYLSDIKVDYFEHIRNGSIIWIFLAMLVAGNFRLLINGQHKNGFAQKIIVASIIVFILILLGIYLILNFSTYGLFDISLAEENTTLLVILFGISTIVLNILRILFF